MGENPEIEGRQSVRTPMQWSDGEERRVLVGGAVAAGRAASRPTATRRSTSTSMRSAATTTRCCSSCSASRSATARRPRSAGAIRGPRAGAAGVLAHSMSAGCRPLRGAAQLLRRPGATSLRPRRTIAEAHRAVGPARVLSGSHSSRGAAVDRTAAVRLSLAASLTSRKQPARLSRRPSDRSSSCARDPRREVRDGDGPSRHRRRVRCDHLGDRIQRLVEGREHPRPRGRAAHPHDFHLLVVTLDECHHP